MESTHSQWREGQTEIVTFADTEGNWYRMEADYDGQSRMLEFRTLLNGEFVGRTNPTWASTEQTQFLATSYDEGFWARTDGDYELIETSLVGAGVLSTGPAAPFALWGSIGALAVQTRNWHLATRALDSCIKATRNRTGSMGIDEGDLEYAT